MLRKLFMKPKVDKKIFISNVIFDDTIYISIKPIEVLIEVFGNMYKR